MIDFTYFEENPQKTVLDNCRRKIVILSWGERIRKNLNLASKNCSF
jgi:hypothetical protein